jgi:Glycosyl hydrolase family 99
MAYYQKHHRLIRQRALLAWLFAINMSVVSCSAALPVNATQPVHTQPAATVISTGSTSPSNPIPTLAYYYIWFDTTSWDRAKLDYPLLGRYSSDDRSVMDQQVKWAKAAGITGFIVSWKSTDVLNRRLEQLIEVAEQENFKLALIYEGLDYSRNPLPVATVANDLDYFTQHFAARKPFQLFAKPLVIWSGTWKYTPQQISQVTQSRRNALLILASERNLDGYQSLSGMVDGNAYYWSSVNPDTFSGYEDKLTQMGQAVHKDGGIWIPPAAPGFDARLIGGTTVVDRNNGATFRTQISTAMASAPDALGIISWNEFSENSYIEPSQKYGSTYLNILGEINGQPAPNIGEFDSSEPAAIYPEMLPHAKWVALGGLFTLILSGVIVIARRHA